MKRVAVAVVIGSEKGQAKVLAVQRSGSKRMPWMWHLPGGKVEEGETLKQTLVREIKEELGVDIVPVDEIARVICTFSYGTYECTFFRANLVSSHEEIKIMTDENERFAWLPLAALEMVPWIQTDKHVAALALLEQRVLDEWENPLEKLDPALVEKIQNMVIGK